MIDPTYVTQAVAWLAVWAAGGLATRNYLAERERERVQSGGAKRRPAPAGKR
jgi:hypothetical protein